jgi:hypothetical protein
MSRNLMAEKILTFQNIGDIVDSAFLHIQFCGSNIQIDDTIARMFQKIDEFLGQETQGGVISLVARLLIYSSSLLLMAFGQ